jgi:uncharacterized protein YndB with AHSA1/START domain
VVSVTKDFSVPADRLYRAWVTPEELKQWWHPMGNQLKEVTNELKEGGQIRYVFQNNHQGHSFEIHGQYEEVKESQKLVYSWNWEVPGQNFEESKYRLSVVFTGQDNSSRLEVRQENFADEEAIHPHREGWDKALNDLQQYLTTAS